MATTTIAEPDATAPGKATTANVGRRPRELLIAGALYLIGALGLFFNVITASLSRAATCTCSDVAQFAWFQQWPWVALRHGQFPFYSTAMFYPHGINLLSNTSSTGIGLVLMPVTALFGPLASLNVALIAAPTLSALSMMYLARRWSDSSISAFAAGALYGFCPLVLFHDALGHLNVTFLAVLPLVVVCLDDLFITHRHRARRVGGALGVLLSWQFFIGSEFFVLTLVAGALALITLAALAALTDREALRRSLRDAFPGLLSAVAIGSALLVIPIMYALFGPRHYSGAVWPGRSLSNVALRSFVSASGGPNLWFSPTHNFLPATYVAPTLIVLLAVGALWRRRDARLIITLVLAVAMATLTLGQHYFFAPWHYLGHLPVLNNVVNERFSAFMFLFLALALARTLDAVVTWRPSKYAPILAGVVALAALSPYLVSALRVAPYPASRVWIPQWYAERGAHLGPHEVVLGFPFFNTSANLLAVQAIYEMRYSVVGGTTPQWLTVRQGAEAPGYRVLWNAASSAALATLPASASESDQRAVRNALAGWKVTYVVLPFIKGPNTSVVARDPAHVELYLSSILGPPRRDAGAWVWHLHSGHLLAT